MINVVALNWLSDYLKGLVAIDSITDEIILELTNKFGFIEDEYDSSYNEDNILYRGLFFEDEISFINFLKSIDKNGFINLRQSSWTEDSLVAQNFMYGEGYNYYNQIEDKTGKQTGFSIKISSEIPTDKVICSYLKVSDYFKKEGFGYDKEIDLITNDSEFIVNNGFYKVEIDMATPECKSVIENILGENHCVNLITQYTEQ